MSLEESEFMMVQEDVEDVNEHSLLPSSSQQVKPPPPAEASIVNVNGRYLEEVVLIPPSDADGSPVIWNENVCKPFVKEKTPSPLLSVKFGSKRSRVGNKSFNQAAFPLSSGKVDNYWTLLTHEVINCKANGIDFVILV